MKKRPIIIRILSYLYFVSPLFVLLEIFLLKSIAPSKISGILPFLNWHVLSMMILTPIVGYGIWSVKKWGYYLLLSHSAFVIFNNITLYVVNRTAVPLWLIIFFNIVMLSLIIVFVRKEVNAPYFNPKIRWWEQAKRYYYDKMRILVKEFGTDKVIFEASSFDVSETGVFIVTDKEVKTTDKFSMELILADRSMLYADGEVVWVNKEMKEELPIGFGCRFILPSPMFKKRLRFHMMDIGARIKERRAE